MVKFIFFFFLFSIALFAEDKLKMKTGSFMSGEVYKVTEKGILFKMKGMDKPIDLQWEVIDDECKNELIAKHGITKEEPPVSDKTVENQPGEAGQPAPENERPMNSNLNEMTTEVKVVEYATLGLDIYQSYGLHLRRFVKAAVEGIDYSVLDGVQIKTLDGNLLRGVKVKETDTEIHLKFNELPIVVMKDNISSNERTVLKMKKGTLEYKDLQKYAETTLHQNSLRLAAFENGVTFEQATYIWNVRNTGGVLPTPEGEKKFNAYKTIRTIELAQSSFLFGDSNAATGLKSFPDISWWKSQQLLAKENVLLAINVLKNFPKKDWTEKSCSACKGQGVIKSVEYEKGEGNKKVSKDKPKPSDSKSKTCTVCSGIKKFYTLRYE